jgi:hypothetical protein
MSGYHEQELQITVTLANDYDSDLMSLLALDLFAGPLGSHRQQHRQRQSRAAWIFGH